MKSSICLLIAYLQALKMKNEKERAGRKRMWRYIAGVLLISLSVYLLIQGIRCHIAVGESHSRLSAYYAETAALSYGNMTYVDKGEGEVILSIHGIFGGYDQAYDTCKDFNSDCRIVAPSRFGYLGSDISGNGTPAEQAAAYFHFQEKPLSLLDTQVLSCVGGH